MLKTSVKVVEMNDLSSFAISTLLQIPPYTSRCARQITLFWLTNTAIYQATSLLGKQITLFRREKRLHPGSRERFSDEINALRAVGQSGPIPNSSITTVSTKAGTFGLGTAGTFFRRGIVRASDHAQIVEQRLSEINCL